MAEYLIDLDEATTAAIHLSRHFRARLFLVTTGLFQDIYTLIRVDEV